MVNTIKTYFILSFFFCCFESVFGQFKDITKDLGILHTYVNNDHIGGGVAMVDVDADGWLDMIFTGGESPDRLFKNLTNGSFEDHSSELKKPLSTDITSSIVSGDFNNDGCIDLYLSVYNRDRSDFILANDCQGGFDIHELAVFGNSIGATLFDFNMDGLLDVYIIGYVEEPKIITDEDGRTIAYDHTCGTNSLLINKGNFEFEDQTKESNAQGNGCSLAVTVIPLPERKTHGVYIANDFGEFLHPNQLLVLNEQKQFQDEAMIYGVDKAMYGMGIAVGDFDQDLDIDLYVSNLGENVLYQNEGSQYLEVQTDLNVDNTYTPDGQFATSWGTFFLDVDNDADLDLFVANGFLFAPEFIGTSFIDPNHLYLNSKGVFEEPADDYGIYHLGPGINRGAAQGDLDNDGDLDIVVSYINFEKTDHQRLIYRIYENVGQNNNHFINIQLEATSTASDAFGSQILLYADGQTWLNYKYSSGIHCSQNTSQLHFGLGDIDHVDSIKVIWPNYAEDMYYNVSANTTILLQESDSQVKVLDCVNSKVNNSDCTEEVSTSSTDFQANPFNLEIVDRQLIISNFDQKSYTVQLYDLSGRVLIGSNSQSTNERIDLNKLIPGIYICGIRTSNKVFYQKLYLN